MQNDEKMQIDGPRHLLKYHHMWNKNQTEVGEMTGKRS